MGKQCTYVLVVPWIFIFTKKGKSQFAYIGNLALGWNSCVDHIIGTKMVPRNHVPIYEHKLKI